MITDSGGRCGGPTASVALTPDGRWRQTVSLEILELPPHHWRVRADMLTDGGHLVP